jgi:uncharacterized protein (TIGR02145 family)
MKSIKLIHLSFLALAFSLIAASSCKKDDNVVEQPGDNDSTVVDKDGNIYSVVKIGTQTWMRENLKTRKFLNGDSIPTTTRDISAEAEPEYQWAYDNNESIADVYGRLYTWHTVTDSRNICPAGWHVPSDQEWEQLKSTLGGDGAGGKLKEAGTVHWMTPNEGATNATRFTALPGGYRSFEGEFVSLHVSAYLWSSTLDINLAWGQRMYYNDTISERWAFRKAAGVSVRCLKD